MSLAKEMVKQQDKHEIIIVLNGLFPETIEPIRAKFDGLLPQENIRVWYAPGPVRECKPDNKWRRQAAECIREAFLASLRPDIIFVTSLFEGFGDDAVTSIGFFDKQTPVFVLMHDLIPLINYDHYLTPNPCFKQYYFNKLDFVKKASGVLCNSESTAQEVREYIAVEGMHIKNISAACDRKFYNIEVNKSYEGDIRNRYNIHQPFILYTGGCDTRKNLHGLIRAYAQLPQDQRETHQLVLAGKMPDGDISNLKKTANDAGLHKDQFIFTGYVTDEELVQLYNLCELFVFPSWHEGFGLPVLEAMSCGAPVICGNKSSLPEVICKEDALFDPHNKRDMSRKIAQVLADEEFRAALRAHGLKQAMNFSWTDSATRALRALEYYVLENGGNERIVNQSCWIDRTTSYTRLINEVSKYCNASSFPEIIKKYAVCLNQNISNSKERQLFVDVSELIQGDAATGVQRVVRSHLRQLLKSPPEDFQIEPVYATREHGYCYARSFTAQFLDLSSNDCEIRDEPIRYQVGDVFFALDMQHHVQLAHQYFFQQLRHAGVTVKFMVHDLLPIELSELFYEPNAKELHEKWLRLITQTDGAICVSRSTAGSFRSWIQESGLQPAQDFRIDWVHNGGDIENSKPSMRLPEDAHIVLETLQSRSSFLMVGTLEPRKGHHQALLAIEELWSQGFDINLAIVGSQGWKMESLAAKILRHKELGKRLFWLEGISDEYLQKIYAASTCLIAASLNEGFGLPLIEAAKHKIPIIARDIPVFKEVAGEYAYYFSGQEPSDLADALSKWMALYESGQHPGSDDMPWFTWRESAEKLKSVLLANSYRSKQLFVDVSELVQKDVGTGIQRVVRSLLTELSKDPPSGFCVKHVYGTPETPGYFYARIFKEKLFWDDKNLLNEEPVEYAPGDIFLGLDLCPEVQNIRGPYYDQLKNDGVSVFFLVHDLFPAIRPDWWAEDFRDQEHVKTRFENWLKVVAESTGAICVSQSTANDLQNWINKQQISRNGRPFRIFVSHNGVDFKNSQASEGLPANADFVLKSLESRPTFLMVGTLEPRKGYTQVLDAFELLWKQGKDINLAIVGKTGWMVESLTKRLKQHPQSDNHLFLLQGISDEYLEKIYATSTCLIAASKGEGFGLPLIEAAQHKLPIIARDIPVFREVAGDHAIYFQGKDPEDLAHVLNEWMNLYKSGTHPRSDDMPWLTWEQSAERLKKTLLSGDDKEPYLHMV
jgi:glycosyltransferase involved in cell wall biosynthesis